MAATVASTRPTGALPDSRPRYRYASFESRVAAAILDLLVLFIIAGILVALGSLIVLVSSDFERVEPSDTAFNLFWACIGSILPAALLYLFVAFAWKGQTIGQAVMQIMVIRSDGRRLGVLGSASRIIGLLVYALFVAGGALAAFAFRDNAAAAAAAVAGAFLLVGAGLFWAAFDRRRRTLHDRIAGTVVIRLQ
jgi:uncharacterized RDD family membrane protein YckC